MANESAAPAKPATPNAIAPPVGPETSGGNLVAWDPVAQKERWRAPGGTSSAGGTLTTAGNLVFEVVPNGLLRAYSADKGEKLLEIQTNLRSAMGPPMTFMLDGKQYVSLQGGQGAAGSGFGGGGASPILMPLTPSDAHAALARVGPKSGPPCFFEPPTMVGAMPSARSRHFSTPFHPAELISG